jgi:hypothetical protein
VAGYVALQVLAALDYAHRLRDEHGRPHRLVHRDVAAGNILVSRAGEVKLADFGVVKRRGLSLTHIGEVKGNPACMAPEQLTGEGARRALDLRVDVFAVGVLLHRMVEGRGPFDDVETWLQVGAPLSGGGPFRGVIARAMALDPDQRFASAAELADAVAAAVPPDPAAGRELADRVVGAIEPEQPLSPFAQRILADLFEPQVDRTACATKAEGVRPPPSDALPEAGAARLQRELQTEDLPPTVARDFITRPGGSIRRTRRAASHSLPATVARAGTTAVAPTVVLEPEWRFPEPSPTNALRAPLPSGYPEVVPAALDEASTSSMRLSLALDASVRAIEPLPRVRPFPLRWVALGLTFLAACTMVLVAFAIPAPRWAALGLAGGSPPKLPTPELTGGRVLAPARPGRAAPPRAGAPEPNRTGGHRKSPSAKRTHGRGERPHPLARPHPQQTVHLAKAK